MQNICEGELMPINASTPVVATNVAVRDSYESLNRVRNRIRREVGEVRLIMIQKHRLRILTESVWLALVAPAFALTGTAAAQNSSKQQDNDSQLSQITVQATHDVQKRPGRDVLHGHSDRASVAELSRGL
jgi:hypothetical protein